MRVLLYVLMILSSVLVLGSCCPGGQGEGSCCGPGESLCGSSDSDSGESCCAVGTTCVSCTWQDEYGDEYVDNFCVTSDPPECPEGYGDDDDSSVRR